jgi:hypothetical protein
MTGKEKPAGGRALRVNISVTGFGEELAIVIALDVVELFVDFVLGTLRGCGNVFADVVGSVM